MNFKSPRIFVAVVLVATASVAGFNYFTKSGEEAKTQIFSKQEILPDDVVVKHTPDGFDPAVTDIKKGTRVVWVNETSNFIWPASDLHPTHERYPQFDVLEPVPPSQAWGFVFDKIGSWKYHDHLFPRYRGTVNVSE